MPPAAGPLLEAAEQCHQRRAAGSGGGPGKLAAKPAATPAAEPAAKRKAGAQAPQDKRRRREAAAPPSDEDVLRAFELFNREGMSAIIAADIEQVQRMLVGMSWLMRVLHAFV